MRIRQLAVATATVGLALGVTAAVVPTSATAAPATAPVIDHIVGGQTASATTPAQTTGNAMWKLAYVDNFTGPLNQTTAWSVYNTPGTSPYSTAAFGPKHVTVSGGQLHLSGYVDKSVAPDGRVVTGGLGLWHRPAKYGYYKMLVRMQACTDVKYAWMLWPYSNKWPADGEIDFGEDEGGTRKLTTASINYAAPNGSRATLPQDYAMPARDFSQWHVIGVRWTPTSVSYSMDGVYWGATHTTHVPQTPMVFVLQTEGKAAPGHVSLTGTCTADIGWVVQFAYTGK